jgi:hypothetical protein
MVVGLTAWLASKTGRLAMTRRRLVDQGHRKSALAAGRQHGQIESSGGAVTSRDAGVWAALNHAAERGLKTLILIILKFCLFVHFDKFCRLVQCMFRDSFHEHSCFGVQFLFTIFCYKIHQFFEFSNSNHLVFDQLKKSNKTNFFGFRENQSVFVSL